MRYVRVLAATLLWWLGSMIFACHDRLWGQAPASTVPPMVCRQVLTIDPRPGFEGQQLLLSVCAPMAWWLSHAPLDHNGPPGLVVSSRTTYSVHYRGGCIRHTTSLRCPKDTLP